MRIRRAATSAAVPALLLVIVTFFYWKITLTRQYTWFDNPDLANQVLPWYQFQAAQWHQGHFPLWDPHEWGGQPLIGQAQPGAVYPLNWILFLLPLRNGHLRLGFLQWYFVIIHFLAALFCYWLCRDLGRSQAASVLAGLGFSLTGWLGTNGWPQMINGGIWAPLIFLFLLRAFRGDRPLVNAGISGAFLGISFLSGHHQIPVYMTLAVGGVWIYYFFRSGRLDSRLLRPAAGFALFLFTVSAFQTLPAVEYGRHALRWVGAPEPLQWNQPVPYSIHGEYGLFPVSVLGIIVPGILRNANPFLGLVIVSLAFIAIAVYWRERMVRMFGTVALGGLIFSLASYSVFHGMLYAVVPLVEKARNPSMAIFIFQFGVVILSAYGVDCYATAAERWRGRLLKVLVAISAAIYLVLFTVSVVQVPFKIDSDGVAITALSGLLLAGILYGWKRGQISYRAATVLLTLLLLLEAGQAGQFYFQPKQKPTSFLKPYSEHAGVVQFLKNQKQSIRVEVDSTAIPYNVGDWDGIDVMGGYLASMTTNVQKVEGDFRARMLFGTNFYVGRSPIRPDQVEVYADPSGLKVYSNPQALPRVWSVHRVEGVTAADDSLSRIQKPLADLRQATFVAGTPPQLEICAAPDQVGIVSREINHVVIRASMSCKGMVILGDTYFPGWQATVDGRPAHVYEAYGVLRGVVVDSGQHRVDIVYRPKSVYLGGALTGFGLFGICLLAMLGRKRRLNNVDRIKTEGLPQEQS